MPELGKQPDGERPSVLLGAKLGERRLDLIIEMAETWGWELLSADWLSSTLPPDLALDGALVDDLPDGAMATQLRERGCPAVRLGRFVHPQDHLLPAVLPDIEAAGRLAAEHFVERRFGDIAFVSWRASYHPDALSHNYPLFNGFRTRAGELGVEVQVHDFWQPGDSKLTPAQREERRTVSLGAWLRNLTKPVGVFAVADAGAFKVCRMCGAENIRVPEEVGVLGYGNHDYCSLLRLPLSAVDPNTLGQTREAMLLLRRLMVGEKMPLTPVMVPPVGVVERKSTDVLAMYDPLAAKAIRYIWEHVCEDPTVDEVAEAVGVSRRSLERVFLQQTGSGVKAEIRRRRLQLYCRALHSSDEPIADLSAKLGYRSAESMHRQFRRATGTTPDQYRRAMR